MMSMRNKPIMKFGKDEQETVILYDYLTDTWSIETNVQKHITILMKKYPNVEVMYVNKQGNPSAVRVNGIKNAISFRSIKE